MELTLLSLGAGVQSTALLMLAADGVFPHLDAAIFSDTGWEPENVYKHLDKVEAEVANPAGIPIYRVAAGHIRDDALNPEHRFASMPLFVRNLDGKAGMARRQCTSEYKVRPIKEQVRLFLGAKPKPNGRPGKVPRGNRATQWIGISTDEFHRAKDSDVSYIKHEFPLLKIGWSRRDCIEYLTAKGWGSTPKSACVGCPFHSNEQWRDLRDNHPAEWADAVDFDAKMRNGSAGANANGQTLRGQMFLHRSLLPLAEAPLGAPDLGTKWQQGMLIEPFTCSPFACNGDERMSVERALQDTNE